MKTASRRLWVVNSLGTLGYLSLLSQWGWALVVLGYPFISGDHSILFPTDAPRAVPQTQTIGFGAFSPIVFVIATAISLIILGFTAIYVIRLPRQIGRGGARITRATAQVVALSLAHSKKTPRRQLVRLTYKSMTIIKLIVAVAGCIVLVAAPSIPQLDPAAIWAVAWFCLIWTIVWFGTQLLAVKLLRVDLDSVW
ncbi:hypothetical protein IPM09_00470 [Candidatus Saccharibacteria bacterium]|nr:MAG: hypothetical protein IPM09_00470 [Candidatus Saccharibacteria bacterium]